MQRDQIESELTKLREDRVARAKVIQLLMQQDEEAAERMRAYETLLRLGDDPMADAGYLADMLGHFGISFDEEVEEPDGAAAPARPWAEEPELLSSGEEVLEAATVPEEFVPYIDCQTIPQVIERVADLQDGEVHVGNTAAVVLGIGLAKATWQHPRNRSWTIVYEMLRRSDRYDYCGPGSATFQRIRTTANLGDVSLC